MSSVLGASPSHRLQRRCSTFHRSASTSLLVLIGVRTANHFPAALALPPPLLPTASCAWCFRGHLRPRSSARPLQRHVFRPMPQMPAPAGVFSPARFLLVFAVPVHTLPRIKRRAGRLLYLRTRYHHLEPLASDFDRRRYR